MNPLNKVWEWIAQGTGYFLGSLKMLAATIVSRILATFGLSMVTFNSILPNLKSFILQYVGALPASTMDFLAAIGIGQAMSMVMSALTIRLAWKVFIIPTAVATQLSG